MAWQRRRRCGYDSRVRLALALTLTGASLLAACSAITSFENFSDRENEVGGASDATASSSGSSGSSGTSSSSGSTSSSSSSSGGPVDGGADGPAGTPVTISNDGFESSANCGPWTVENGTATIADVGHTGGKACLLCSTETDSPRLKRKFANPGPGEWKLEVWAMQSATDAGVATKWKLRLNPGQEQEASLTSSWTKRETTTLVAIAGLSEIEARIQIDTSTIGRCMLVDDIVVTHTPP